MNTGNTTACCLPPGGVSTTQIAGCPLFHFFHLYPIMYTMQMNDVHKNSAVRMAATVTSHTISLLDIDIGL